MKTAQGGLAAILTGSANVFMYANLYTFGSSDGDLKITSWQSDLIGFTAAGYVVKPGNFRTLLGLEDPTLQVTVIADAAHESIIAAAANGHFDGHPFKAERLYMTAPGQTTNRVVEFTGIITDVRPSSSEIQFNIGSVLALGKNKNIGRAFQAQCPWVFGGPNCGVTPAGRTCDHTRGTCATTFSNLNNFGGFPDSPPPPDKKY